MSEDRLQFSCSMAAVFGTWVASMGCVDIKESCQRCYLLDRHLPWCCLVVWSGFG